jgi:hypothetical protein
MKKTLLICAMLAAMAAGANAQILINDALPVVTSFTGWNGALPSGFSVTGESTAYQGTSAATTGGLYAVDGFDYQPSSSADNLHLTGSWLNNTGETIVSLTISYSAFEVVDRASRDPGWTITSSLTGDFSGLTWTSSQGSQTPSVTISGLSIAAGDSFSITWNSDRGTGASSSPMIGLNDISVTATTVPEPGSATLLFGGMGAALWAFRRRRVA